MIRLEERPVPEPGPGYARVRLLACGICGTDLHFFHAGFWPEGHVAGHEMFGEVDETGDAVTGFASGDRVAIEPIEACGKCPACLADRANICPEVRLYGIHAPGGFAEAICAPQERLFRVPDGVDDAIAALAEPLAVALHGVRRGHLEAQPAPLAPARSGSARATRIRRSWPWCSAPRVCCPKRRRLPSPWPPSATRRPSTW